MPFDRLEFADVKEYRVQRTMLQLSSILPAVAKLQANGSLIVCKGQHPAFKQIPGSSDNNPNTDGEGNENESRENIACLTELLRGLAGLYQLLTGEIEVIEINELRARQLSAQADAAVSRFRRLGVIRDIDEAIELRSQALSYTPDGHQEIPFRIVSLGAACLERYMSAKDLADLNKAIEYLTQATQLCPDWRADKSTWLNNLGSSYGFRFMRLGELEDLNMAIQYQTHAEKLAPEGYPEKHDAFNNLRISLEFRFERLGELTDLDTAIKYHTQAMLLIPDGHPDKPICLHGLGRSHYVRFGRLSEVADVNKAIDYHTRAVELTPDGHRGKPALLSHLGNSYQSRFAHLGELADADKAIDYQTQAVQLAPDEHPHMCALLNNLALSHESRFGLLGERADVNKAIEYQARILLLTPDGHLDKPSRFSNLGYSHRRRFNRFGEVIDINKAVEYYTQALLLTPDGHADKIFQLDSLGSLFAARFRPLGELEDVNKAIEYQTQALLLTPDGHTLKPGLFKNLGGSYNTRFDRLGQLPDLKMAIEYNTQAVLLTPDGHPNKPAVLYNLGRSYSSRFRRIGELVDLNRSIEYIAQAMPLTPDGHPGKPLQLSILGNSYQDRFVRLGKLADLNTAIEYKTQEVLLTPDGHPERPSQLATLGDLYEYRFHSLGDLADLSKAIEHKAQAALLIPDGHPAQPAILSHLGTSYTSRFRRLGELTDLNLAIEYSTQGVMLTPDGRPEKPSSLDNLGNAYEFRFRHLGELADVNKAIHYRTRAIELAPDGHPDMPIWLNNLGGSYDSRFRRLRDRSDLELTQSSFQRSAQLTLTHPQWQFRCARQWAWCALSLSSSPQAAYERCMELIPHYIWLGTTIDQRYMLLSQINDLATEAAAWAISVQAFDLALEWLEEGRSIVWKQILQLRTPFDDLFIVDPLLAQELKDTASKLEAAGSSQLASLSDVVSSDLEKDVQYHHHLASEWERLLEKAREIPGFQRFLCPRKAQELMFAASDGPIVVLNAHSTRCDALVILPGCDDIIHIPLPMLLLRNRNEVCVQPDSVIGQRGDLDRGFKRLNPEPKVGDLFKTSLAALWLAIVQPVLDKLACTVPADELPHVTWCTTGALSFLPLHAAGIYDGSQPTASDLILSSYTPSLSALLTARNSTPSLHSGVLAVGQEQTSGFCRLPNTIHELAAVKEHANATHFRQLDGSSATVDAVLSAMDNHSWVHLACHATQHPDNPAQSAFYLYDGTLTLETITKRSFKNKGLAFLSACQTATGDQKLADESVHLAAGMLMAGYPSVIATMWSIQDEDGPQIAEAVYADLLKDGKMDHRQAARALHKAVAGLREKIGHEAFERWVPFIHMGV